MLSHVLSSLSIDPHTWGLKPDYGIETIQPIVEQGASFDFTYEWGDIRAALNHSDNGDPHLQGNYLHGKNRVGDYTHGCICERSETILKLLLQLSGQTPGAMVPTEVK